MLGPAGERWVPVHGIVPHSGAAASVDACEKFVAERRDLLEQHEIRVGYLFSTVAAQALLVEPVIYWPDSHTTYHKTMVEPGHLSKIGEPADNARARAVVDELRRGIAAVLRAQGAVHFQLGRFYDYRGGRDPAALQLFDAIRASLDPQGIINPGVLG
jgi:FAD/FMN-containing dehydrogenase